MKRLMLLEKEVIELKRKVKDLEDQKAMVPLPQTEVASKNQRKEVLSNKDPRIGLKKAAPQEKFVSISVKCVATGTGHNDRAPCSIAIVSTDEEVLFNKFVLPCGKIKSYLTPLTGIISFNFIGVTDSLDDVLPEVKACLGPHTVVIGHNPEIDIQRLGLVKGIDYKRIIDLSNEFAVEDKRFENRPVKFPLKFLVDSLLSSEEADDAQNTACGDCFNIVRLYNKHLVKRDKKLKKLLNKMLHTKMPQSVAKLNGFKIDGVCLSAFNESNCSCGQPPLTRIKLL